MTRLDIRNLSIREELLDSRYRIIRNISGLGTTNKECWPVVCEIIRFFEREISHFVQRAADD